MRCWNFFNNRLILWSSSSHIWHNLFIKLFFCRHWWMRFCRLQSTTFGIHSSQTVRIYTANIFDSSMKDHLSNLMFYHYSKYIERWIVYTISLYITIDRWLVPKYIKQQNKCISNNAVLNVFTTTFRNKRLSIFVPKYNFDLNGTITSPFCQFFMRDCTHPWRGYTSK